MQTMHESRDGRGRTTQDAKVEERLSALHAICGLALAVLEFFHAAVQTVRGERKHSVFHEFTRHRDGWDVFPRFFPLGVQPDGIGIDAQQPCYPRCAGLLVPVLNTAACRGDLIGRHGRIADEDNFVVPTVRMSDLHQWNLLGVSAAVVLPDSFINKVMKVKIFKMLEFGTCRGEQLLTDLDVVVHGTADVQE